MIKYTLGCHKVMHWGEILSLSDAELKSSIASELESLRERYQAVRKERLRLREAIADSVRVETLLGKLVTVESHLVKALGMVESLCSQGDRVNTRPSHQIKIQVMHELNGMLANVRNAVGKIIKHISDDERTLLAVDDHLVSMNKLLMNTSGWRRYINYANIFRGDTRLIGNRNIRQVLQDELHSNRVYSSILERELLLDEDDMKSIAESTKTAHDVLRHLKKSLPAFAKNPRQKEFLAAVREFYRLIAELIRELHILAEDEEFLKATGIKIIKLERSSMSLLKKELGRMPKDRTGKHS
jgi:hypothetical protein